jgi:hypothetical protein
MFSNINKFYATFAAWSLATFLRRTTAATVQYAGTFGDYFGDAYDGPNEVLNSTERAWLTNGRLIYKIRLLL